MHWMIFGCGYSGKAIARELKSHGAEVSGTTRAASNFEALQKSGAKAFVYDGEVLAPALIDELKSVTHLVQSIGPLSNGSSAADPLAQQLGSNLKLLMPKLKWVGYLSTIGVYSDAQGGWVDEETPGRSEKPRSQSRLGAEKLWIELGAQASVPVAILRLAGIYGPGRNVFCRLEQGTARRIVKKDQVFNRIRVEDIAASARFLAERGLAGIFNVTDNEPGPPQEVIEEGARLMGVSLPPEEEFETAEMSPMAKSFYSENKRVRNSKLRDMGFEFRFPDYRSSLKQLWNSGEWKGCDT